MTKLGHTHGKTARITLAAGLFACLALHGNRALAQTTVSDPAAPDEETIVM